MGCHTRKSSLQLAMQRHCVGSCKENFLVWHGLLCSVASWKALLTILEPTSTLSRNKILLLQVEEICSEKNVDTMPVQLAATCCLNLLQLHFVAWQFLRRVVIRPTTLFNLQRNNVSFASYRFQFLTRLLQQIDTRIDCSATVLI